MNPSIELEWDKKNARFIIASIYGDYDFTKIKSFVKNELKV